jgi:eukaryotic-like serine/threonine-protein kinase
VTMTSLNPGDQLDDYRIVDLVARSATASVFRATDLRTNRVVAIKIPHPEMASDPVFSDRFDREEEIGKSLHHPGILTLLADEHDRQRVYMVMEWFDGQSLRHLLTELKKLPEERAVRIALAVCEALGYIHSHGIVHRNLKPENILVDAEDHIKLINFDIAAKAGAPRLTFTSISQAVGASVYISPEELKGKRSDSRADLYSLGVILYEMLTGTTPFRGTDPFDRIRHSPIPPRELDPDITPQLQEVIYRALEPEPVNRYANANDFSRDLQHLDQVGIADRPELRDWKKRKAPLPRKILLYAAMALIPILIFGLLLYFARR